MRACEGFISLYKTGGCNAHIPYRKKSILCPVLVTIDRPLVSCYVFEKNKMNEKKQKIKKKFEKKKFIR